MLFRLIWTLAVALAIPALGLVIAQFGLAELTGDSVALPGGFFETHSQAETVCRASSATIFGPGAAGGGDFCIETARLSWLRDASATSGILAVLIVVVFLAAGRIAGADRRLNAAIFPRLMPIATWTVAALIFVNGAILTYGVARLASGADSLIFWILVGLVGAGAFFGGVGMVVALRGATAEHPAGMLARPVTRAEAPQLWAFVDALAKQLDAQRPKNLIVGLEPTFFATAAPIATPERERPLEGETMFLSLPLMRLLTRGELAAVVAHELGHFRGADTAYSIRFAPVYRDLVESIRVIEGDDGRADSIATLPASAVLNFMLETFARNERKISRDREFAADAAALSVTSAQDLAVALAKAAVFAPLWSKVRQENVARLGEGKISRNLSKTYADSARYDVSHQLIDAVLGRVLEARIAHPTDSHPPTRERYARIGFEPSRLTIGDLTAQGDSAADLLPDLTRLEEELTLIEHKLTVSSGAATPPEGASDDTMLNAAYILAATMTRADGKVETLEVKVAETAGAEVFMGFDPVSFRETLDHLDELPGFIAVVEILKDPLSPAQLAEVHRFLTAIASADGEVAPSEARLLDEAARRWNLRRRTLWPRRAPTG